MIIRLSCLLELSLATSFKVFFIFEVFLILEVVYIFGVTLIYGVVFIFGLIFTLGAVLIFRQHAASIYGFVRFVCLCVCVSKKIVCPFVGLHCRCVPPPCENMCVRSLG